MRRPLSRKQKLTILALSVLGSWLVVVGVICLVMVAPGTTVALFGAAVLMTIWGWNTT